MSREIEAKLYCIILQGKSRANGVSAICHIPGLSGFGTIGSFDCCPCCLLNVFSIGSLFSLEMFVPDDFFMPSPSIPTFDSSALVVFFMLCFGVPKGDEN